MKNPYQSMKNVAIGGLSALVLTLAPGYERDNNNSEHEYLKHLNTGNQQEQVLETDYKESALEKITGALAPNKAYAGGYERALEFASKGNELQLQEKYEQALPILEKSLEEWKEVPPHEMKGGRAGNYAATLSALASCYVHTTIDAYSNENDLYPNSLERFRKAKNLAEEAIETYELCQDTASGETKSNCYKYASGAFNVLGLANKYLGKLDKAEKYYNEAIKRRDNPDAEYNLKRLEDNFDVFLR